MKKRGLRREESAKKEEGERDKERKGPCKFC